MIVFAHTKFGLVRIQGSGVKRGGGIWPEQVFEIPVQIKLKWVLFDYFQNISRNCHFITYFDSPRK